MEQKNIVCSLCSASNTSKVKYFQLKDAIRSPDGSQFDGFTELHRVLKNILNIEEKNRKATNYICRKCRDKLHGIYSFTLQRTESEKIFHQITDVTVRLKKLKTFFILTDLKKEFEAIAQTDKDVDSLECISTVVHNCDVSNVMVKMECDNHFEGIDFNKVMKDANVKYLNAADSGSVEQRKIDSMGTEDAQQITIDDELIKEEWTLQEGVIFESKAKHDILDREQIKFGCDVYDEEFATVSCLNEHTKNVHEMDLHKSNQTAIEHFERHIQRVGTKNKFACDQCEATYKSRRSLKDHKLFHAGISLKCDQCDAKFKNRGNLYRHKISHGGILYNCDQCDAKFKSRRSLHYHKISHTGLAFTCNQCDATYKSKGALNSHKKIHSGILFNCDLCDAKFKGRGSLHFHKISHTGLTFTCNQCDATYKSKGALNMHKQTHSGILFNCDQCDAKFKTSGSLRKHKISHSGLTFTCNQCDATYKSKDALNQHKQIHSGISINCDQCDAIFKSRESLQRHKISHTGLTFTCDQCNATYKSKGALNRHKHIHSGRAFNCDQCDAKFNRSGSLRKHKISHSTLTFTW